MDLVRLLQEQVDWNKIFLLNTEGATTPESFYPLTETDHRLIESLLKDSDRIRQAAKLALTNAFLITFFGCTLERLERKTTYFGRPFYSIELSGCRQFIDFNVSASQSYVALAAARPVIGIDIEVPLEPPTDDFLSISRRFFHPAEFDYITSATGSKEQYGNFLYLWTRKEAYLKAGGIGLSGGLDSFCTLDHKLELPIAGQKQLVMLTTEKLPGFYLSWVCAPSVKLNPVLLN